MDASSTLMTGRQTMLFDTLSTEKKGRNQRPPEAVNCHTDYYTIHQRVRIYVGRTTQ